MTASWNVELVAPLGGTITNLPGAKGLQLTASASEGSTFSFTINGFDPKAKLIHAMFTDIVVYREGRKMFRGRCVQATVSGDAANCSMSVSAVDYKALLKRRFVIVGGTNTGDLETISWNLIDAIQNRAAGCSLGITRGVNQTTGITVTNFQREQGAVISDLIDSLGQTNSAVNASGAFEWDIDPDLVFKVYQPTRGKRTPTFVADFGGSVLSYDEQFDPNGYGNTFFVQGAGAYLTTVRTDDARRPIPGGIFEEYYQDGSLATTAQVDNKAFWLATYNGQLELTRHTTLSCLTLSGLVRRPVGLATLSSLIFSMAH